MKNASIIIILLITFITQSMSSQNYLDSMSLFKTSNNKGITTRTVDKSETASYLPSSQLKRNKIVSDKFLSETTVCLYMREYIDNKKIESDDHILERTICSSRDYFSAEIVADTSNCKILTIYTMTPSGIGFRYRNVTKDHKFKSIPFSYKSLVGGKDIPIIFLYEDDIDNNMEKILNKYTKSDSLPIQFNHLQKPFSEIKRYITIFYTTTKEKKHE